MAKKINDTGIVKGILFGDALLKLDKGTKGNGYDKGDPIPTKEQMLAMTDEEVEKLTGNAKRLTKITRTGKKNKGKVWNPKGKNQYTERNLEKEFVMQSKSKTLERMDAEVDNVVDMIMAIARNEKNGMMRLRALELMLAYQLGKPNTREAPRTDTTTKTYVVMPEDKILPTTIEKAAIVLDPEKKGDK